MDKNIYELKLHEILRPTRSLEILRVPGGWIYVQDSSGDGEDAGYRITSQFVPFNKEFKPKTGL